MILQRLYLILICACCVSCYSSSLKSENDYTEENVIINIVFNSTVGHDTIWTRYLKLPPPQLPPFKISDRYLIECENHRKEVEKVQARLDTASLFVFIDDSIVAFPENREIKQLVEHSNFQANFPDTDMSYIPLILQLIDSTQSRKLDISSIKTPFKYKLEYNRNRKKYSSDIVIIGNVTISRVAFNDDKTKACVYSQISCGQECGGGHIIFLEKMNGDWIIKGKTELWVS